MMSNNTLELPLQLSLENRFYGSEVSANQPSITLTVENKFSSHTLILPNNNKEGVLRNDGTGYLEWGPTDISNNILNIIYTGTNNDPLLNLMQNGVDVDSALKFHIPAGPHGPAQDYTIGIDASEGGLFTISNSPELGIGNVFTVSPAGIFYTNITLPFGEKTGVQGVITIGNSHIYNIEADRNTFYGLVAGNLTYVSGAIENTAYGSYALTNIISGSQNVAIGSDVMQIASSASNTTAVGYNALRVLTTGNYNTAVGSESLESINTTSFNSAFGGLSLPILTSGNNNTGLGYQAGTGAITGSNNTFVGYQSGTTGAAYHHSTAVGANAQFDKSNKVQLGDPATLFFGFAETELTLAELQQLSNINNAVIGSPNWLNLSSLDQETATTSDVIFRTVTTTAGISTFNGNVEIDGDLRVTGSEVIVKEIIEVKDAMMLMNTDMPPQPGVAYGYSGIEINRGTLTNYRMIFDETLDTMTIGIIGSQQPVATREENPLNGGFATWDAATKRFVTSGGGWLTPDEIAQLQNIDDNIIPYEAWKYVSKSNSKNTNLGVGTGVRNSALGAGNLYFGDGSLAASGLVAVEDCIAIGRNSLLLLDNVSATHNIGIGANSGSSVLTASDNIFIGYNAGLNTLLGHNVCIGNNTNTIVAQSTIVGDNSTILHHAATRSIIIGQNSTILDSGVVDTTNTILLGSGLTVTPTGPKQLYTVPNLDPIASNNLLVYSSVTGQIGPSSGSGIVFNDDIWITDHILYFGEKTPVENNNNGVSHIAAFGGVTIDGSCLFGYEGGVLGTKKTSDKVAMKWDDSQAITVYGNINLPYANASGLAGVLYFGATGARIFAPSSATSSFFGGYGAGTLDCTGGANTGFGMSALSSITSGSNNSCYGFQSGYSALTAVGNTFLGYKAGYSTTSGNNNVAIALQAMNLNDSGYDNVAIGRSSLNLTVVGYENIAIGSRSLYNSTNHHNTSIGFESGFSTTTGSDNTFLGYKAGYTNIDGSNNTAIGVSASVGASGVRRTAIGYGSSVTADDTIVLGDDNVKVLIRQAGLAVGDALTVTGNIAVTGNVDGVDIGAWKIDYDSKVDQDVRSGADPIFDNMTKMVMSGFDSWSGPGPVYYTLLPANTFRLDVGGVGYIKSKKIVFAAPQSVVYIANATNYIYIDSLGIINVTSSPSSSVYENNIVLFELLFDGITTPFIKKENHPYKFNTSISTFLHNNLGSVIRGAGAILTTITTGPGDGTSSTDIQVKMVTQDVVEDHGLSSIVPDSAGAAISITYWYLDSVVLSPTFSKWICRTISTSVPLEFNNPGAGITALSPGFRGVMRVYVSADNLNSTSPTYVAVMHTAEFASIGDAETAINSGLIIIPTNELQSMEPCQLGYLIVNNTNVFGFVEEIIIQKNTFNSKYVGGIVGSGSHLLLSDINGGQYSDGGHDSLATSVVYAGVPTINDDIDYYKKSSMWVSTTPPGGDVYLCTDNAVGAAVWKRVAWSNLNEIAIGLSSSSTVYGIAIGTSAKSINGGVNIGYNAGSALTSGAKQVAIGYNAGNTVQSGSNGVFIGNETDGVSSGIAQIAIGDTASVVFDYGVAIGVNSKAGGDCVSIGQKAGYLTSAVSPPVGSVYIGSFAGAQYTTGTNICIGYSSGYNTDIFPQTTLGSTIIGEYAGYYVTGDNNTLIGKRVANAAGYRITSGTSNVCIGYNSGIGDADVGSVAIGLATYSKRGNNSVSIGSWATIDSNSAGTDSGCVAIGQSASCYNRLSVAIGSTATTGTGMGNTCIGPGVFSTGPATGANNVAIGRSSMTSSTSASSSVCIGAYSGSLITTGTNNTAIGYKALFGTAPTRYITGGSNVAIGYLAMTLSTATTVITAASNIAVGSSALNKCATGNNNIGIGVIAGDTLISGTENINIGYLSDIMTDGNTNVISIGTQAKTTNYSIAIGYAAGMNASDVTTFTTARVIIGTAAGVGLTNLTESVIIGCQAGRGTGTGGNKHVIIGALAASGMDSAVGSTLVGYGAGLPITTGGYNTLVGYQAGDTISTGSVNICIGQDSDTSAATTLNAISIGYQALAASNSIAIGYQASALVQNQIIIGSALYSAGTRLYGPVGINQAPVTYALEVLGTIQSRTDATNYTLVKPSGASTILGTQDTRVAGSQLLISMLNTANTTTGDLTKFEVGVANATDQAAHFGYKQHSVTQALRAAVVGLSTFGSVAEFYPGIVSVLKNAAVSAKIELAGGTSGIFSINAPLVAAALAITLPATASVSGSVLMASDAGGTLTWSSNVLDSTGTPTFTGLNLAKSVDATTTFISAMDAGLTSAGTEALFKLGRTDAANDCVYLSFTKGATNMGRLGLYTTYPIRWTDTLVGISRDPTTYPLEVSGNIQSITNATNYTLVKPSGASTILGTQDTRVAGSQLLISMLNTANTTTGDLTKFEVGIASATDQAAHFGYKQHSVTQSLRAAVVGLSTFGSVAEFYPGIVSVLKNSAVSAKIELAGGTSGIFSINAPLVAAALAITLPATASVSGSVLMASDAGGTLTWSSNILDSTGTPTFAGLNVTGRINANTTTYNDILVGFNTGVALTTGASNTFVGYQAGDSITTGSQNICIGSDSDGSALILNQISIGNTATTGAVGAIAFGSWALASNQYSVAIGSGSASSATSANVTGDYGIAVGYDSLVSGTDGIAIGRATTATANQVVVGSVAATTYKYNGFNTYITPTALSSVYTVSGSVWAGFTFVFPASVSPWHAKITLSSWDDTDVAGQLAVSSTSFEATGGHGASAAGGTILLGPVMQCGSLNSQFDTFTGDSATQISVTKTANYIAGATRTMKCRIYIEMHFGTAVSITGKNGGGTSISF